MSFLAALNAMDRLASSDEKLELHHSDRIAQGCLCSTMPGAGTTLKSAIY